MIQLFVTLCEIDLVRFQEGMNLQARLKSQKTANLFFGEPPHFGSLRVRCFARWPALDPDRLQALHALCLPAIRRGRT